MWGLPPALRLGSAPLWGHRRSGGFPHPLRAGGLSAPPPLAPQGFGGGLAGRWGWRSLLGTGFHPGASPRDPPCPQGRLGSPAPHHGAWAHFHRLANARRCASQADWAIIPRGFTRGLFAQSAPRVSAHRGALTHHRICLRLLSHPLRARTQVTVGGGRYKSLSAYGTMTEPQPSISLAKVKSFDAITNVMKRE